MLNILLIGSHAREHALAKALARSSKKPGLYCCGSTYNIGIAALTVDYQIIDPAHKEQLVQQAHAWRIDIAIIGSEAPLANGLADYLWHKGIACIGPTKEMAQIETSKIFARNLLYKPEYHFAPRYQVFHRLAGVKNFLHELGVQHYVIKPDGLTAGKGVKVAGEHLHSLAEAYDYCVHLHQLKQSFLIEKKCTGQEFSLHCFSDGNQGIAMPVVKDFKRAYVHDQGPNTGSMGSLSDANHRLPFLSEEQVQQAQRINQTLLDAVQEKYQKPYKGILYGSYMATDEGIKLIEFNARFGDPEALNLLALLDSDLVSICEDIIDGTLGRSPINFAPLATVCKYAVPQGYPDHPLINQEFHYQEVTNKDQLYFASVHYRNQKCYTTSSRTAAVLALAPTLAQAEQLAEVEIKKLKGPLFHRQDIGLMSSYVCA
jgi:phosphoribosylamine---glycine ligase